MNAKLVLETVDLIREHAWQQGRTEGEAYGAGRYNAHFSAGDKSREQAAVLAKILGMYLENPAAHECTLTKIVRS